MLTTNEKGTIGRMKVVSDLVSRGYLVFLPVGEGASYDIIIDKRSTLQKIECKYTESDGETIIVRPRSVGRDYKKDTRLYTAYDIDWIAVYDLTSDRCYYIPSRILGDKGMTLIHLRLSPPKNGQIKGIRWANDYTDLNAGVA